MGKKQLKFLSISEALEELKNTLAMQSELKKQEEIEPILARIEDFEIIKISLLKLKWKTSNASNAGIVVLIYPTPIRPRFRILTSYAGNAEIGRGSFYWIAIYLLGQFVAK